MKEGGRLSIGAEQVGDWEFRLVNAHPLWRCPDSHFIAGGDHAIRHAAEDNQQRFKDLEKFK
jgi:hypothetical protein